MPGGNEQGWRWSPGTHPNLPDRVVTLESDATHVRQRVDTLTRWLRAATAAGWAIAMQLLYMILQGRGL